MFIEIMTHILTIENIIMAKYNIPGKTMNECLKINKESVREQLK